MPLNAEGGFEKLLNIPDSAGSHTLKVFSVDTAGNQKTADFSFLVKGARPIVDDDEFVTNDPTNPPPTSPTDPYWSDGNTASRWFSGSGGGGTGGSSGGSGMWGYGVSPGNSPAVTPSGANPNGDPNAPENKPLSYLEKVSIILDQAMKSISTSAATVTKKAALKNRLSLLMEVADLVDEKRLYDRMRLTFYGIYDEAEDLITNRAQARDRGTTLASEIIADPDAMKLETFQATLVGAVNQVFARQGYSVGSTAKEESLVNALLKLAETYGSLNPTRATDNASTPDFLDSLWRVQQTIDPKTPLSLATIRAELERGIGALNTLLTGVQNKAQALKFVNNLLLAATDVVSLDEEAITDAQFLRELVAFGFQYARLNPNNLTSATTNGTDAFLATFWQNTVNGSTAMRQATGKLDDLFAGLETKEERLKLLKFETNLLRAIGQGGQELLEEKQDSKFLSALMQLGGAYAALKPTISPSQEPLNFFLDTLWNIQNPNIQKGMEEVEAFFAGVKVPEIALKHAATILKSIKAVDDSSDVELQGLKQNPELLKAAVEAGRTDKAYTFVNTIYGESSTTGVNDPWAIIGAGKFIDYIKEVEAGYPQDTPEETVTRVRNIYYGGLPFIPLIPNSPYYDDADPVLRLVESTRVSREAFNRLNAQANENTVYGRDYGDNPSPYILRNGEHIDVGHAFLTLDALLHPGSERPYTVYNIPTIDPASWIADVALAVAWVDQEQQGNPSADAPPNLKLSSPPTSLELDLYYNASASVPDLLGDIDGFGLFYEWQTNPGRSLSEVLQSYYGGENPGVNNRWLTFCRLNGFVTTTNGEISWRVESIRDELVQRVNNMAGLTEDGFSKAAQAAITGQRSSPYREFPYTDYMLNKFLSYVYQNLQRELGI